MPQPYQIDLNQPAPQTFKTDANGNLVMPGQDQSQGQGNNNGLLDFLLPTAGAVGGAGLGALIPGLGETGISEVGGAAVGQGFGKALDDWIQGKKPGMDVAANVGEGALGGLTGLGINAVAGPILSKILGNAGEDIASNGLGLTRFGANAIKQMNRGESVGQTLVKNGLSGADAQGVSDGISKVQQSFDVIANNAKVPINQDTLLQHSVNALDLLKNSDVPNKQALAGNVDQALSGVFDKISSGKYTSIADLNASRKMFDAATPDSQFGTAEWNTNRIVGDVLRKSVQDTANSAGLVGPNGQSINDIGQNLSKLYNIQNAANKRIGQQAGGNGIFSLSNAILGGMTASTMGLPPIVGDLAAMGARKAMATQFMSGGASKLFMAASKAATSNTGKALTVGAGAAGFGALSNILQPGTSSEGTVNQNNNTGNNNSDNGQGNIQNNQTSSLSNGGNVSQTGGNVNANAPTIKLSTSNDTLPAQLPDAQQLGNTIPGQIYSPSQQAADIQKWTEYAVANPYNPGVQTQAQLEISKATSMGQINDKIVSTNLQQMGLSPQQSQFILSSAPTWQTLGALQQSIQSQGGKDLFQTILQTNPAVRQLRAMSDSTGQYGHMLQLMNTASAEVAKMNAGASPTDFQVSLEQAFSPSNNIATNLANLDQSMKQMYKQYQQYAPFFHMQFNAPAGQQQTIQNVTNGNDLLMNMLQKTAQ